jgi:uncharacterized protein with beta-barrel porin domain
MFGRTQLNNTLQRLEEMHDEDGDFDDFGQRQGREGRAQSGQAGQGGANGNQDASNQNASNGAPGFGQQAGSLDRENQTAQNQQDYRNPYGNLPQAGSSPLAPVSASAMMRQSGSGAQAFLSDPRTLSYTGTMEEIATRQGSAAQTGAAFQALSNILPAGIAALNKRLDLPAHVWFAGSMTFGNFNSEGLYSTRFNVSGVTIGADRKFFDGFKAGIAFGLGFTHTSAGTDGTATDALSYSATLYGSYKLLPHTFIDVIAGGGRMNFTNSRYSSDAGTMLGGNRSGTDVYGSLGVTEELKAGPWKFAPYARIDVVHIDLAAYNETGSELWGLTYNELSTTTVSAVAGTRIGYTIPQAWGTLTPTLRLESSHALTGGYSQVLSYTSLPGTSYLLNGTAEANSLITSGLGLRAASFDGFTAEVEYLLSATPHFVEGQQFRGALKQAF